MKEWVIITNKPGQLGNQLAVFAHFIAWAEEHKVQVLNTAFEEYAPLFEGTSTSFVSSYPVYRGKFYKQLAKIVFGLFRLLAKIVRRLHIENKVIKVFYLDWNQTCNLDDILSFKTKFCLIDGWRLRGGINLIKHKEIIKAYFRPIKMYTYETERFKELNKTSNCLLVGVHIRQGDYQTFMGGKYFFNLDQYIFGMHALVKLFHQVKLRFAIFSNTRFSKENFKELDCVIAAREPVIDMYCLASCDYIIGPPSTFSSWASFYGSVPLYVMHDPSKEIAMTDFKTIEIP